MEKTTCKQWGDDFDEMDFSQLPFFTEFTIDETHKLRNACNMHELRREYKKLALLYHPDKGGDPEKFKKMLHVYENMKKCKK